MDSTVSNALVPAQNFQKDLQIRAKDVSDALVKFTGERRAHVEKSIAILQGVSQTQIMPLVPHT